MRHYWRKVSRSKDHVWWLKCKKLTLHGNLETFIADEESQQKEMCQKWLSKLWRALKIRELMRGTEEHSATPLPFWIIHRLLDYRIAAWAVLLSGHRERTCNMAQPRQQKSHQETNLQDLVEAERNCKEKASLDHHFDPREEDLWHWCERVWTVSSQTTHDHDE